MYKNCFKRVLDILLSGLALLVLSPVLLVVAILVRIKLGAPVLFKQQRVGKDEKIFTLYKFRTMTNQCNAAGELLPDAERLTGFGMLLRRTSLDELPELINIFKGDMSIIGPRPLLVEYIPLYNAEQRRRHAVRPGLSGLAQISGRNAISWEDRFCLDVTYVDNITFWGDIAIILKTVWYAFVRQEGISGEGEATMKPFSGTREESNV